MANPHPVAWLTLTLPLANPNPNPVQASMNLKGELSGKRLLQAMDPPNLLLYFTKRYYPPYLFNIPCYP